MRILSCLIGIGLVLSFPGLVSAKCGPEALGTSRTIMLDPKKHRALTGKEASLGLRHKEVILTFDDGPIAGKTSRILKSLKKECVKATFFYVGTMARAYPKLVRKVVNQGHTLAHHTHSHNRLPNYSSAKASSLIDKGVSRLQKIAYSDPSTTPRTPFFRYPYLARSKRTDRMLAKKGMIAFGANIDSLDWKQKSPKQVHNRIMRRLRKEGRGIILMHDIQSRTAKMLPDLLRSLKSEGYRVVHMVPKLRKTPASKPVVVASLASSVSRSVSSTYFVASVEKKPSTRSGVFSRDEHQAASYAGMRRTKPLRKQRIRPATGVTRVASQTRSRKRQRRSSLVVLAGAKPRGTIGMGKVKLRRSMWILR